MLCRRFFFADKGMCLRAKGGGRARHNALDRNDFGVFAETPPKKTDLWSLKVP